MTKPPNQKIINAFGISGTPAQLPGGEGNCFRVNDIVFKPTNNLIEATWLSEINNNLKSGEFRVPKPIPTKDGAWVFENWTASEFLPGEHHPKNYAPLIELSQNFHKELAKIPKPDWFDKKTDVFSIADKMAWGELPTPDFELTSKTFQKIFNLLKTNTLPNQLIHGDWGAGQILFHPTLPPAVLDMTPYFRPANFPIADMIISALVNENADIPIINLVENIENFEQLLLRALVFRTCTYVGFQIHPENNHDWTEQIKKYVNFADILLEKIK